MSSFATGWWLLVAAAGESCTYPWVRWGAAPGRRASNKHDTVGVPLRNCPDRSWCWTETVRTLKAATPAGKPHAQDSGPNPSVVEEKGQH